MALCLLIFFVLIIHWQCTTSKLTMAECRDTYDEKLHTLNATYAKYAEQLFAHRDACNIEIVSWKEMSVALFYSAYYERKPFIIDYEENQIRNSKIRAMCDVNQLLWHFGEYQVTLSSSNTYSYDKKQVRFADYVKYYFEDMYYNLDPYKRSNDTWYFFGDNDWNDGEWKRLIHDTYEMPSFAVYNEDIAIAFGLGGVGSGVPFHIHGHGFSEVIDGEKRWFLFAPHVTPEFEPNMTTFYWFLTQYDKIDKETKENGTFYECVIKPGQLLYFPSSWYHATLNYAKTTFVTAFI